MNYSAHFFRLLTFGSLLTLLILQPAVLWSQDDTLEQLSVEPLEAKAVLSYVNGLFDQYNRFDSKIVLARSNTELVFTDQFSRLSASIVDLEFRRVGENMGLFCRDGENCLSQTDIPTGEEEPPRNAYTFGIKQRGKARPETDTVIDLLNRLLKQVQTENMERAIQETKIEMEQLMAINSIVRTYVPQEELFRIAQTDLVWYIGEQSGRADLASLSFYIDYSNKALVLKCIQSGCIAGSSSDQFRLVLKNSEGDIAPEMDTLLSHFNALRKEILSR